MTQKVHVPVHGFEQAHIVTLVTDLAAIGMDVRLVTPSGSYPYVEADRENGVAQQVAGISHPPAPDPETVERVQKASEQLPKAEPAAHMLRQVLDLWAVTGLPDDDAIKDQVAGAHQYLEQLRLDSDPWLARENELKKHYADQIDALTAQLQAAKDQLQHASSHDQEIRWQYEARRYFMEVCFRFFERNEPEAMEELLALVEEFKAARGDERTVELPWDSEIADLEDEREHAAMLVSAVLTHCTVAIREGPGCADDTANLMELDEWAKRYRPAEGDDDDE